MPEATKARKRAKPSVEVGADEARQQLGQLINRAGVGGERIVLTRHGMPVVAIVSITDLQTLEAGEAA